MSNKDDSADKTEKPTAKRLRDARKKGDVSKSKELTSTLLVLTWLIMLGPLTTYIFKLCAALFDGIFHGMQKPLDSALLMVSSDSLLAFVKMAFLPLVVVVSIAALVEYLQVGPVFTTEKIKLDISKLNPAEGVKRMFSLENWVELAKSIVKTATISGILILVLLSNLDQILKLVWMPPSFVGHVYWHVGFIATVWIVFVFLLISVLDALYQRFNYIKKLKMSRRDLKQELKDEEGDPYVKQRRKQLHQEWAQQNTLQAVRNSSVVVTNPTHYSVAIYYHPEETGLPVVAAKGEDYMAALIRETAEEAGIPIINNILLARDLYARAEVDDFVPADTFQAVAEVLKWAQKVREQSK